MAEEGKAKYAAEIWELVRLFSRLGKTVYGLLLLLVAWVLMVKTGREMLASKDTVDLKWYHPSVSFLTIAGAAGLTVGWLLHSRLLSYAWAFARHFLKPAIFVLAYVVPILLFLLNLALLPVTVPLTHLARESRRRRFKANWLEKRSRAVPGETSEQRAKAWREHLDAMEKAHGKEVIDRVLIGGSWEPSYFIVVQTCTGIVGRLLRGMLSRCRVGLAPITPQSYVEEFLAAKLPLQVFAQAITRIRGELGELALLDRIQFIELPPSAHLQQSSQAVRYAWLFDTDVLLWGTYKASVERVISLNLLSHLSQRKKKDEKDEYGNEYQRRFFPWEIRIDFPALSFDQDDEDEVYLVLLVAEILALQGADKRWEEGWRRMVSGFQVLDRLSLYSRETVQEVLLRVIPPALGRLGNDALPERKPITGRHALVDLAGRWVGSMLNVGIMTAFEELSKRKGTASTLAQLRALAEACARLKPKNAVAHYRVGALRILTNAKKEAIQSFRQAGKLEKESFQVHEIGARVAADMTVNSLTKNEDIALAVWAAHAACALNTGDEYAIADIRDMVEKKLPEKLLYALLEKPEPLAITVIREMLPPSK